MKEYIKNKYQLSSYKIAQIEFFIKTFLSESSKIIIMGFIFHKQLFLYFFALFFMIMLRCNTGGIHFYTYIGCLTVSTILLWLPIIVLSSLAIPHYIQLVLLLICLFTCYAIGPVGSRYRPVYSEQFIRRCKKTISIFIFFSTLIIYIIPDNPYSRTGFWIIILHTLQLFIARILKKGDQ